MSTSSEQLAQANGGVALVTAGARRLGSAICVRLAELGYDIALHYHSSEREALATASAVEKNGRKCSLFKCDFANFEEVQQLMSRVVSSMGAPKLLVNNASVFVRNKLMTTTPEAFDTDFNVHVKAPYFLTQAFALVSKQGNIVNIVDTSIVREATEYFSYLLSKKALYELTRMSAKELAPAIRVNCIAPGIILPPEGTEKAKYEALVGANPLKRQAELTDILIALDYLLKNQQVTGQCMFVDGGDHIDY